MGKGKKIKSSTGDSVVGISLPLDEQIDTSNFERRPGKDKIKEKVIKKSKVDDNKVEDLISSSLSAKILKTARKQQLEEELFDESSNKNIKRIRQISFGGISLESEFCDSSENEDEFDESIMNLDPAEEKDLETFITRDSGRQKTLYDLVQEKIRQKQGEIRSQISETPVQLRDMDPKLEEMYRSIGVVLSRYRSGKVPKAFKVLPKMTNWEQILHFYSLVLLPRIRDDIDEYKKLNFHLYQALKKSLYKPAAFVKGILLPLCESGSCTLREATIIGSVLIKCSFPWDHSAAAMLKFLFFQHTLLPFLIAEMDYTGANSLFLRILIDKKYTLPFRVIDALVFHFLRFSTDSRKMPVLWHQAFLALCQRYKCDINSEQRESLLQLIKVHNHHQISPEIRRELHQTESRDQEDETNVVHDQIDF